MKSVPPAVAGGFVPTADPTASAGGPLNHHLIVSPRHQSGGDATFKIQIILPHQALP